MKWRCFGGYRVLCKTDHLPSDCLCLRQKYTMEPMLCDTDAILACRFNKLRAKAKGHTSASVKVHKLSRMSSAFPLQVL